MRALLARPALYDALQALLGAERGRAHFVASFVRPQPGDRVLDVGCGTARILDHLPAGAQYWGYDISEPYIDAARERYGARGKFFCRPLDERELAGLPKFDIVLATGVLHHLDDAAASGFLRLARSALADGGRFVSIDPCLAPGQSPLARLLITRDRGEHVRDERGYRVLAEPVFARVQASVRHRRWIPYTHCFMECSA